MALSLSWPGRHHFRPIGSTSSVCLTRDVAPENSANILLLACGDLRNVLYTVFCEAPSMGRTLDFTCCDLDPGVLARDILLLAMIIDGVHEEIAWNIFYHMYLDVGSRSTLITYSQRLASYSVLDAWRSSPYGAVIRIGTEHTLTQLRRYWELYADFYEPTKSQRFQFLQKSMDRKRNAVVREHGRAVHFSSARSSGPLIAQPQTIMLSSEQFEHYWKTGTTFTDADRLAKSTHPNATFFHSRAHEGFDVHYTTDPMVPFHHAPLFADTSRAPTIKNLVESAKSQFREWYSALRIAALARKTGEAPNLVVRFLLGDALAISRAFQVWPSDSDAQTDQSCTAFASAQWTTCTVDLDREEYTNFGAPVRFDVIDTSTLSDDVGMHNVFLCAAPLLATTPTAVLYTESIFARTADPVAELQNKLFADLSVLSLLLDLAPVDALSGFTTRCNTHELTIAQMTIPVAMSLDKQQCHQTFTWKRPTSGDTSASSLSTAHPALSFDKDNFANLLHKMYSRLFEHEDPGYVAAHSVRANPALVIAWASSWCPSRESLVMLLALIRARARVQDAQWSAIMRAFLDILYDDAVKRHPFDALGHNEIYAQLYRYGLHTVPGLDRPGRPAAGPLSRWSAVPPLVRIFLTAPRASFEKLKSVSAKLPNPWLHCCVTLPRIEHAYQSVDAAYGTVVDNGTTDAPDISIVEDQDAPTAVFSFVVTGHLLTDVPPDDVIIRLATRTNPMAVKILTPILGPDLNIFSARLQDANHVHLAPEQPLSPQPFPRVVPIPTQDDSSPTTIGTQPLVQVTLDATGKRIAALAAGLEIENAEAKASVAGSASPDVSQISPCVMQVVLGQLTQTLVYPLPIVGSQCKVRIARKSSYIEVVAPVAIPFLQPDGYKLRPFPIVRVNQATVSWNLHRVPLDRLPVLNISPSNAATVGKWFDPHVSSQLSARASALKAAKLERRDVDPLANLKDTLHFLMVRGAGTQGSAPAWVIALRDDRTDDSDSDTLFFVDKVRFDVAAHTVVLDAFVLPLFPALMRTIRPLFEELLRRPGGIVNVRVYGGEMRAWKLLLPALVERCRTAWTHGANCEYAGADRIPLEGETGGGDPLCSCGRGKDVDGMLRAEDDLWAKFAPFVTRVAISPLFAVSYVERVIGQEEEEDDFAPPHAARRRPGVKTSVARCNKCRKEESSAIKLLRCSKCRTASYCSEACQKSDWKVHKLKCRG